jgi:hypothetical protein
MPLGATDVSVGSTATNLRCPRYVRFSLIETTSQRLRQVSIGPQADVVAQSIIGGCGDEQPTNIADENAPCGKARCVSDHGSTVSITDVPQQQKVRGAFDPEEETHGRPQEVGLTFLTARVGIRY